MLAKGIGSTVDRDSPQPCYVRGRAEFLRSSLATADLARPTESIPLCHALLTIAAIITKVHSVQHDDEATTYEVDLFAMYPNGTSHKSGIRFAEKPTLGCWSWPPRV